MSDLTGLTLKDALEGLKARRFSAVELAKAHQAAIEAARSLNAYVLETPEKAIAMAEASDVRLKSGDARPLEGATLGIKDLFCTEGVQSTAGSKILGNFIPPYESTVTANLWRDGAVMLGKLNMDEFAMGSSNETSAFGPVVNPWRSQGSNRKLTPGGSSGGSAASVAANLALGATATDTGGSIRQPASLTGTVGVKPTYGRCSRWGVVAFASSLDQAGPLAKTVEDAAILLRSMSGHDPKDSTSLPGAVPDFPSFVGKSVKGLRIGVPKEYRADGMPPEIEKLWADGVAWLKDAGCEIVDVSLPHTRYALPAYYIIAPAEASSNLARYDGMRFGLRVDGPTLTDTYEATRAAGFGDGSAAAGADGRLRALGRLLRRLLPEGAEGAPAASPTTSSNGVRQGGRAADADRIALRRLRPGRKRVGPGGDVFERRLHRDGEPRRAAGAQRSGWPGCAGPAARPAADRASAGRRDAVPARLGAREGRRLPRQAVAMVASLMAARRRQSARTVSATTSAGAASCITPIGTPRTAGGDGGGVRA